MAVLSDDVEEPSEVLAQAQATLGEFRRSLVLVPIRDGGILTGDQGGVRWIYAFTDTDTLTAFAQVRGEGGEWEFRRVYGARLLDETVGEVPGPCGVAVDVGSEGAFVLPPAPGIVPDTAAVTEESEGASA
ncbi:SseB family protein [Streptomyces sp. DSM 42041]|uniref:SseB family protein n=1 Tax=Streptomyces hazeniae TaxID=3075538 RepID=A0ABU2NSW0_9ACTN|nr:SseB family protein [Streptomyces sp. DSM 42041]MDT0380068.1 SseB family protein [Streptomyces sp. DSM 42041]